MKQKLIAALVCAGPFFAEFKAPAATNELLTGERAMGDWKTDSPGVRRKIVATDLPPPNATKSANNHPKLVPPPSGATPKVPPGFRVERFAERLTNPRMIRVAPNGDLF